MNLRSAFATRRSLVRSPQSFNYLCLMPHGFVYRAQDVSREAMLRAVIQGSILERNGSTADGSVAGSTGSGMDHPYASVKLTYPSPLLEYGAVLVDTLGLNEADAFDRKVWRSRQCGVLMCAVCRDSKLPPKFPRLSVPSPLLFFLSS